ncbi:MAG: hypothetical protein RIQ36_160 [Pseudomonadota bacterium]
MSHKQEDALDQVNRDDSGEFRIHYYLDDQSHQMDAFTRNQCELEMLSVLSEVGRLLDMEVSIETKAYGEGGLQEYWNLAGTSKDQIDLLIRVLILLFGFTNWAVHIRGKLKLTEQQIKQNELTLAKTRLEIKKLGKEVDDLTKGETRQLELEALPTSEEIAKALLAQKKVAIRRSNMYEKLISNEKVKAIGFSKSHKSRTPESQVARAEFSKFIVKPEDVEPISIQKVTVEIVSPVLRSGKTKWRGILDKKPINFEIGDPVFLLSVLTRKVHFENGTTIVCDVDVLLRENELGEIETAGYVVSKVHQVVSGDGLSTTNDGKQLEINLDE